MRSIGFRAQPSRVDFAVLEVTDDEIEVRSLDKIVVPQALELPEQLAYLRTVLHDLIREFEATRAGVRTSEAIALNQSTFRLQIEAVIQEALAGSTVGQYFVGGLQSIAARVPGGLTATDLKAAIAGDAAYEDVEGWEELSENEREALLAALAAAYGR